jgi:3-dehydroquinate dehydratase II
MAEGIGAMMRVVVVNGPNLNLLGSREPGLYGKATLAEIEAMLRQYAAEHEVALEFVQSNHEGVLVDTVQGLSARCDAAIVNLGGYTHTSVALRDAFLAAPVPFIEVHLSNLFARETARHHSLTADLALGVITGLGAQGYLLALQALIAARRNG